MSIDGENDGFTAEEQAYFDNGGEAPSAPAEVPKEEPKAEAVDDEEVIAVTEDAGDDEGEAEERKKQDYVPQQALHKERERRKAAEQAARNHELELARMSERLALFERQTAPKEPETRVIPKPEEDIIGALQYTQEQIAEFRQREEQQARAYQQQQQVVQLVGKYKSDAEAYKSETPDFPDAYQFLTKQRDAELKEFGLADPVARDRAIKEQEFEIVQDAYRTGRNPAEVIYKIAKARGYAGKGLTDTNVSEAKRDEARAASKSLSGTGASPSGPMTAERLLAMNEKEFNAYSEKNPGTIERIMGR